MKILVAIASFGTNNDRYLEQLIHSYMTMVYEVDVVVVSNISKSLPVGVEVVVGLPSRNPWSLPFAHKTIFAERQNDYDLFIYSEDDTLVTQRHVDAFLNATEVLEPDEIAGFMRSEQGPDGRIYYSTIHHHYHWDPTSVCRRGNDTFAFFTNEHSACYMLTQKQLQHSIASGGFLVPPHEGKYDMLVSAATDPYTRCGLRKLVCISRLEDFTCKHLTNKYVGRTGLEKPLVDIQIRTLLSIANDGVTSPAPIRVEPSTPSTSWPKSYYEPSRDDLLSLLPQEARRVLSIGCGWGKTEETLLRRDIDVTAIPLDIVIGQVASARGIRVISETLETGSKRLAGESFDALLIFGLIHQVHDPTDFLREYSDLLVERGTVIVSCPNMAHVAVHLRRFVGQSDTQACDSQKWRGIHKTSFRSTRRWLVAAGFSADRVVNVFERRWKTCNWLTLGLLESLFASEFAIVGRKLPRSGEVA